MGGEIIITEYDILYDKGYDKGRNDTKDEDIRTVVDIYRNEFQVDPDSIKRKIMERFQLNESDAQRYVSSIQG